MGNNKPIRIDRFLLIEKIASGGMGEVYRGKSVGPGGFQKQLAIKKILANHSDAEGFQKMFEREAKLSATLNHANIAQTYDFLRVDDTFLLVMEFVEGKNLRQILTKATESNFIIPFEMSAYLINQVCNGLDYAHRRRDDATGAPLRIIHQDISPQNIMVSYEGEVKIVDFGIAKATDQKNANQSTGLQGKLAFMSPEQATGGEIDHRSDLFSVGVVFFELLTGMRLFTGKNSIAVLKAVQECNVPSPRVFNNRIPSELEKIVLRALAKDVSLRYQTASAMQSYLQDFLRKSSNTFSQAVLAETLDRLFRDEREKEKKAAEERGSIPEEPLETSNAAVKEVAKAPSSNKLPKPPARSRSNRPAARDTSSELTLSDLTLPKEALTLSEENQKLYSKATNELIAIPLDAVPLEVPLPLSLFISIGGRNVLFRVPGDTLAKHRADSLSDKGLEAISIPGTELDGLIKLLDSQMETVKRPTNEIEKQTYRTLLRQLLFVHCENVHLAGVSITTPTLGHLQRVCGYVAEWLQKDLGEAAHLIRHYSDPELYSNSHNANVAVYCASIAAKLNLSVKEIELVALSGAIHDLGNIFVDKAVLNKTGTFTPEEINQVMAHPTQGSDFLSKLGIDPRIIFVVKQHHERMNGKGYPAGLKGEAIHLFARICAVTDVFDALTSVRPSAQKPFTAQGAARMMQCMQDAFDPKIFHYDEPQGDLPLSPAVFLRTELKKKAA